MQITQSSIMQEKIKQMAQIREERVRARRAMSKYTLQVLNYLLMAILAVVFLFPVVGMVVSSFKSDEAQLLLDIGSINVFIPYGSLSWDNYIAVFQSDTVSFVRGMFNSLLVTASIVVLGLFVNSLLAYAMARLRFVGRSIVIALIAALVIVPFESISIPLLLLVNNLPAFGGGVGWTDTYYVQIIPFIANASSIFIFYQFFLGFPKELEEAALVDGASRFRIFWQIVVPLSRPVFATIAIMQFLAQMGAFLWPLMVTTGDTYRPLMVSMQTFFGQPPREWGPIMAFATMATLPTMIVFLMFQGFFIRSIASSGIKG